MLRAVLCLGFVLLVSLPAQAWTRAQVRDVRVELSLRSDGQLDAALSLRLEVQSGWLERLELPGLDEGLVLDPEQPAFISEEDGARAVPELLVEDGVVVLRFERSEAPQKGVYRTGVRYVAQAARGRQARDRERLSWTLPGWEAGLERAEVVLRLPKGAEPVPAGDAVEAVHVEEQGTHALVRFTRVHLPRATPWTVSVDLPVAQAAQAVLPRASSGLRHDFHFGAFQWAALFVLFTAWSGRSGVRRGAAREGMRAVSPWGSARAASAAAGILWALAIGLGPEALGWSLAALLGVGIALVEDVVPARAAVPLGRFEPVPREALAAQLRAARRTRLFSLPWTDAGTLVGGLGALACAALSLWGAGAFGGAGEAWALGLACALVPWVSASRWRRPRGLSARLAALVGAAAAMRVGGCALRLVWYVPSDGARPFEPRLRVVTAVPCQGVLRMEIVTSAQRGQGALSLLVVVSADSLAERALASTWGHSATERSHGGKRVAFVKRVQHLDAELTALLCTLSSHAQRLLEPSEVRTPPLRSELAT